MSDDDNGNSNKSNQATVVIKTAAAKGLSGNDIEVRVRGGEGEEVKDIEETAKKMFQQAVESSQVETDSHRREYH